MKNAIAFQRTSYSTNGSTINKDILPNVDVRV